MIRPRLASYALALRPSSPLRRTPISGWGQLNMTEGVTEMSRQIYELHMLIFWMCVVIGGGRLRRR